MLLFIIYMLTTGILWTLVGIIYGKAPNAPSRMYSFFAMNSLFYALFIWIFRFPQAVHPLEVCRLGLVMLPAVIAGLVAFWLLKYAMACGSQGVAWSIMQSSLVLPFLGSILFLKSHAGIAKYIGVFVILVGLALLGFTKNSGGANIVGSNSKKFMILLFSAFLLDGVCEFIRLIPGNIGFSEAALTWRLPISVPLGMIIWFSYVLSKRIFVPGKVWQVSIIYSVVTAAGQICYFLAVDTADLLGVTSIVYPVSVGSSIVLFALYCVFFRKEKYSFAAWIGVVAITLGITLLSIV